MTAEAKYLRRLIRAGKAPRTVFAKEYDAKTDRWVSETYLDKRGRRKRTWRQISSYVVLEKSLYVEKPK